MKQVKPNRAIRVLPWLVISLALHACDVSDNTSKPGFQQGDPIVEDFPIAYIERTLAVDEDGAIIAPDLFDQSQYLPGAKLILKARASASAPETILTEGVFEGLEIDEETGEEISLYDIRDLNISPTADKLIFSMHAPDDPDDPEFTWNIWEYDLATAALRQVISDRFTAEAGDDVSPHYLPDGRIVFSSNRQSRTKAILLDEFKPQYSGLDDKRQNISSVLHVMDDDGTNIEQISFNGSHDLQPTVTSNGKILFLRWDAARNHDQLSLYRANPDGSQVELLYGYHEQNTGTNNSEAVYFKPREMPDGRILVNLRSREAARLGGDLVAIDIANYISNSQGTHDNLSATGPAQQSITRGEVDTEGQQPSGSFNSAFPLNDGTDRLLVSWSQCRLLDPDDPTRITNCTDALIEAGAEQADPLYGLWVYDVREGTQLPVKLPDNGKVYLDAVVLSPRTLPEAWYPTNLDPDMVQNKLAVVHIHSVYDLDGADSSTNGIAVMADPSQTPPDQRQARFLRIVKNVPIPDDDVLDFDDEIFGGSTAHGMKEIIGYVPVEPDGSAKFVVPLQRVHR